jgi:CheY-like chemotaxis protein
LSASNEELGRRFCQRDNPHAPPRVRDGIVEALDAQSRSQAHAGRTETMTVSILVVDDEPDVVELFRQRFRREVRGGTYAMHFAASGEGALQLLASGIEPQLIVILSDINMPGMDGLALLREIKTAYSDLPVMMVTAYGDDERRRVAAQYGAVEFLTKPVDFDLLKGQLIRLHATSAGDIRSNDQ